METPDKPSKTQLKREMHALQELGEALAALPRDRLDKIDMPDRLRDAVRDYQRFTKHEAKRRQMQFIGKLMRDADTAPIQAAIDEINGVSAAAAARLHALEKLRTRLLEDEQTLGEIAARHVGADLQHLRQLRRTALKEQAEAKPPRAYRELFRVLRQLEDASHDPDESGTADE